MKIEENRTRFQNPKWTAVSYRLASLPKTYFKDGVLRQRMLKKGKKKGKKKRISYGKRKGQGKEELGRSDNAINKLATLLHLNGYIASYI